MKDEASSDVLELAASSFPWCEFSKGETLQVQGFSDEGDVRYL